ncbi:MAG: hypothetical protein DMG30_16055 [Acidobacteria bacterium]|nr:MAG: hypothetical protein DMG30_16055 [Acidobacteriota bacterium]
MQLRRSTLLAFFTVIGMGSSVLLRAQRLPLEPLHDTGQNVTGAFEGWFKNRDGSFSLLFGYYNRNQKQDLEIPVGPNNRIEPGGPDQGQPTHFLPGRQWGLFTVTVPADFGADKLTWTLISNGQPLIIPGSLNPLWEINAFREPTTGNTPPVIKLAGGGSVQGPRPISTALSATLANPLTLTVSVSDDATMPLIGTTGMDRPKTPPVTVIWSKFRGPGIVTFANAKPAVELANGEAGSGGVSGTATTSATFSEPGEYVLLVVANDWSGIGGHGYQCCWTNSQVKVSVKP